MTCRSSVAGALLGLVCVFASALPASAQLAMPAETPPASFTGTEYVDSNGCVFLRVGVGDRVDWVPRVGADRAQICGQTPTALAGAAPPAPPAPAAPPPAEPEEAVITVAEAMPPAAAPTHSHSYSRSHPPRAAVRTASVTVHAQPVITVEVRSAPLPVSAAPQVILPPTLDASDVILRSACSGHTGLTARYLHHADPRCAALAANSYDVVNGTEPPHPPVSDSPVRRLLVVRPSPPPGYRSAWSDGRLNPYRGMRTVEGDAQMRMIWTDTVPRRLVPAD